MHVWRHEHRYGDISPAQDYLVLEHTQDKATQKGGTRTARAHHFTMGMPWPGPSYAASQNDSSPLRIRRRVDFLTGAAGETLGPDGMRNVTRGRVCVPGCGFSSFPSRGALPPRPATSAESVVELVNQGRRGG